MRFAEPGDNENSRGEGSPVNNRPVAAFNEPFHTFEHGIKKRKGSKEK